MGDLTGLYDIVRDWPKPMSQLPGHENWGWGAVEGVFAEGRNRVFIVQRGELPVVKRPPKTPVPEFGPSLSFPTAQVPFRNASQGPVAALPGGGAPGQLAEDADKNWNGRLGVDARWEDNIGSHSGESTNAILECISVNCAAALDSAWS
jgi:hypothetical protein